jgi:hypothetical protein
MIPFHYQCSRRSTSGQISDVFDRAIDRQVKAVDEGLNLVCFIFMDKAGLPEEGRESLKVLHYYLEDNENRKRVGFVAISNHVLDAAKTNRCKLLTNSKPDHAELLEIAKGCFGSVDERSRVSCSIVLRQKYHPHHPNGRCYL